MLFCSTPFVLFLAIVLLVYYSLSTRAQNVFLIAASYFFYGWWDWRFCGLLIFSTLLDYVCALRIRSSRSSASRFFLWASVAGNLGVLGFFKYWNFFVDSFTRLLLQMGFSPTPHVLQIILPVGISFYTFQTMSYTIDVYRKRVDPTHSLIEVAAYVSFFPQLVAGPIERAGRLLHQFRRKRTVTADMLSSGALLIALGFFKKLAIADAVAPYATRAFSSVQTAPWHMLVTGAWFFAIQIYCDFSAYSDIARGVARLLGFNLMVNFNQPYFSTSITEFWRRWHISLSTWLRDYLYIPLGGNRCGRIRSLLNVIITMILGGLWHGANWTFLLWGTLHGCYVVIHRLMLRGRKLPAASGTRGTGFRLKCFIKGLLTFHLVLLAWIVFRCTSLAETWQYMTGLVSLRNIQQLDMLLYYRLAFFILLLLFIDIPQYRNRCHEAMLSWHWAFRGVAIGVMIVLTILLAPSNETPFVYFQF